MTGQEIEKLREKLGDGFEVTAGYNCAFITVKDTWKGVEFITVHEGTGKVFKVIGIDGNKILVANDVSGSFVLKQDAIVSTESAYVEQLKAKAKELYGEIKDGVRFQYDKESDTLYLHGFPLYNQGKWAKKDERVRVVPSEIHYPKPDNLDQYVTVELRVVGGLLDSTKSKGAIEELAKCLEDYLNKSQ